MGGSSKSGGGGKKDKGGTPAPAVPAAPASQTFAPFMPGFDQQIAQQLGMGFGQDPNAILAQLSAMFRPVQAAPAPVIPATPAPSSGGGGAVGSSRNLEGAKAVIRAFNGG